MKIAIDIDEVLADTLDQVVTFYNNKYSPSVKREELTGRYLSFLGETWEESNVKYFEFCESKFSEDIKPVIGSQEAIEKLAKNFGLIAITGRPAFVKNQTLDWMNKYFPGKFEEVIFNNNLLDNKDYSEYWGRPKAEICDEVGAGILIDDMPKFMDNSKHLEVYLFDRPWNQDDAPDHAIRVYGWSDLIKRIGS